eukprot:4742591-Prorocentrum_lima.AAC.1
MKTAAATRREATVQQKRRIAEQLRETKNADFRFWREKDVYDLGDVQDTRAELHHRKIGCYSET